MMPVESTSALSFNGRFRFIEHPLSILPTLFTRQRIRIARINDNRSNLTSGF